VNPRRWPDLWPVSAGNPARCPSRLIEFDAAKPPPRRTAEDMLRLYESWKGSWNYYYKSLGPKYAPMLWLK